MPACFSLTSKDTGEKDTFQQVDDLMREHFKVAPDKDNWYFNWYNHFGVRLATGSTIAQLIEECTKNPWTIEDIKILEWLEENYTVDCWYEM